MLLEIEHISKSYPGLPVLHDVSLGAADGEIVCLLGPSGCGKSTLLRLVAGLETPDTGRIIFDGQEMAGTPPHRRRFGLMFQDYALFPHKDVLGNVAFGLRMARLPGPEISRRVDEALALVGLSGYERRRVTELSGGEQQRVALARSLAPRPRLVMLDEPLGALDRALREQLMNDLRAILKQVGVTALYVTHDQEEAFAIADRIAILHARLEAGEGGHIEQIGAPGEVYRRPASVYVARFLGFRNLVEGRVVGRWQGEETTGKPGDKETRGHGDTVTRRHGDTVTRGEVSPLVVETPLGALVAADLGREYAAGEPVTVLIRPEAAQVCAPAAHEFNLIHGRLRERSFRGSYERIQVEHASGITLTCEAAAGDQAAGEIGDVLPLYLAPSAISLLKS